MVFQDPMTSLNPALTVGRQITESLRSNLRLDKRPRNRAIELLRMVGIPEAETPRRARTSVLRWRAQRDDRHRARLLAAAGARRRITTALDVTIGADPRAAQGCFAADLGTAVVMITHDPASWPDGPARGRDVRRPDRRGDGHHRFRQPADALHLGLAHLDPAPRLPRHEPLVPIDGTPARSRRPAAGVSLLSCVPRPAVSRDSSAGAGPGRCLGGPSPGSLLATQHVDGGGLARRRSTWRRAPGTPPGVSARGFEEVVEVAEVAVGTRRLSPSVARIGDEDPARECSPVRPPTGRPPASVRRTIGPRSRRCRSLCCRRCRRRPTLLTVEHLTTRFKVRSPRGTIVGSSTAVDDACVPPAPARRSGSSVSLAAASPPLGASCSSTSRLPARCASTASSSSGWAATSCALARWRAMFQDPYASLNPRMTVVPRSATR